MFYEENPIEEVEIHNIMVGKEFPLYKDSFLRIKGSDQIRFEANDFNQGFYHMVYYAGISPEEVNILINEPVRVRLLENSEGLLLLLFKFGKTQIIQEASFDPTLYEDAKALQLATDCNMVNIFCIDSNTNILKGIRTANLPLKFIQKCRINWSKAFLQLDYSKKYAEWYSSLQRRYDTKKLWDMAVDVGYLGESYNLDEIRHSYER